MKLDLLVMDWSGTISDDFPMVLASVNRIMDHFGKQQIAAEELRRGFRADVRTFYSARGITDFKTVARLNKEYFESLQEKPKPIPEAVETVKELSRYAPIAIFSSHPESELQGDIIRYGLGNHIKFAMGGVNKADGNHFGKLLELTKADKAGILYVGDTIVDIALSKMVGVANAGVVNPGYGYQYREQLEEFEIQPTHGIMEHITELPKLIKNRF